ncbi:MAG: hypothetical protein QOF31_3503 [Mycobacterium sp.]|jgi:hypothetical protein|nr:hypothetical protein [Mycobacterium sp.]
MNCRECARLYCDTPLCACTIRTLVSPERAQNVRLSRRVGVQTRTHAEWCAQLAESVTRRTW